MEAIVILSLIVILIIVLLPNKNLKDNKKYIESMGEIGEKKVIEVLEEYDENEHKLINNLIIIDDNGKSHQIDHVEIRKNGIFCIETKNYSGKIYGKENHDNWVQYVGKKKNEFYNPIKQNNSHIFHLKNILENKYYIHSLIVFAQNNSNNIDIDNVINLCNLKDYLNNFNDNNTLTVQGIEHIYNKLISYHSNISNTDHVKNINKTKKEIDNNICPRCKGKLVLRKSKYGAFYECSNYPNCKFKINKAS